MFRYKNAKYKSNYLKVRFTAGTDYKAAADNHGKTEPICLHKAECEFVLSLFPGEHTATARYEAGYIGDDTLIGETVVHYAYHNGKIEVCDYDFTPAGNYEIKTHDIPPSFRLLRRRKSTDALHIQTPYKDACKNDTSLYHTTHNLLIEEQPLLEVSSSQNADLQQTEAMEWMDNAAREIRTRLRTTYAEIQNSLYDTGIFLSIHMEDHCVKNPENCIVQGTALQQFHNWSGYFFNLDQSSYDAPEEHRSKSWIKYYDDKVKLFCRAGNVPLSHPLPADHKYCAAANTGFTCNSSYYGGHIMVGAMGIPLTENYYVFINNQKLRIQVPKNLYMRHFPVYNQFFPYYMLPICNMHNNTNYCHITMYAHHNEDLLQLICFRADLLYK